MEPATDELCAGCAHTLDTSSVTPPLKIMVLAGGPDRERPVSLQSGSQVANALREADHDVRQCDILPDDLSCLDDFHAWRGDVIFPVLHGPWGEGGPLQQILQDRNIPFVGCDAASAALCMDKVRTKQTLLQAGLNTPAFQLLNAGDPLALAPPLVLKPPCEGSSIDLVICHDMQTAHAARIDLHTRHLQLLAEQFIPGMEITVGVIVSPDDTTSYTALPPIHIIPATAFYDYQAKYERDDTQYRFELPMPEATVDSLRQAARRAFAALGCRHMARVDFMVDAAHTGWILEVNTIPGFTTHSLLPMAGRHMGLPMPALTDLLARAAMQSI